MPVELQLEEMNADDFNKLSLGYDNVYWAAKSMGFHLPNLREAKTCLPANKILNIVNENNYCPMQESISKPVYTIHKITAREIYYEINQNLKD